MATILIVDDEPLILALLRALLRGHTVIEASNGVDALELYRTHSTEIQLVITDLSMPRMHGTEMLCRLWSHNPDLRAIVITGWPDEKLPDPSRTTMLQKPFQLREMQRAIQVNLGGGD